MKGKPKRFSLPAFSEEFAFRENDKNEHVKEIELSISSSASALAGVEGETTPAHTQGAGAQETANPPKAAKHRVQSRRSSRVPIIEREVLIDALVDGGIEDAFEATGLGRINGRAREVAA